MQHSIFIHMSGFLCMFEPSESSIKLILNVQNRLPGFMIRCLGISVLRNRCLDTKSSRAVIITMNILSWNLVILAQHTLECVKLALAANSIELWQPSSWLYSLLPNNLVFLTEPSCGLPFTYIFIDQWNTNGTLYYIKVIDENILVHAHNLYPFIYMISFGMFVSFDYFIELFFARGLLGFMALEYPSNEIDA